MMVSWKTEPIYCFTFIVPLYYPILPLLFRVAVGISNTKLVNFLFFTYFMIKNLTLVAVGSKRKEVWETQKAWRSRAEAIHKKSSWTIYGRDMKRIRKLYYSDNLPILKSMASFSIDLIYLDPPFHSQRAYHIHYRENGYQSTAFIDTWRWHRQEDLHLQALRNLSLPSIGAISALIKGLGKNSLSAYLINMSIRLVEMRRVLKNTGSVYLHCDPTASHYLKIVLDAIFGYENFKNEIAWRRGRVLKGKPKAFFPRNHDIILSYSKKQSADAIALPTKPYKENTLKMYSKRDARGAYRLQELRNYGQKTIAEKEKDNRIYTDAKTGKKYLKQYLSEKKGVWVDSIWEDIEGLEGTNQEKFGYPTQKPLYLLDRIIRASCPSGGVVLDPFCGCGTTIISAEKHDRSWIGIDITYTAIGAIQGRFRTFGGDIWKEIDIHGCPKTLEGLDKLRKLPSVSSFRPRKEFEKIMVSLVGGLPSEKRGSAGVIDGFIRLSTGEEAIISIQRDLRVSMAHLRALKDLLVERRCVAALLVMWRSPSKPMEAFVRASGFIRTQKGAFSGKRYPVLQILTAQEVLEGVMPRLPLLEGTFPAQIGKKG